MISDETARAAETARLGMTLEEAKQILNVTDLEDLETIQVTRSFQKLLCAFSYLTRNYLLMNVFLNSLIGVFKSN